MSEDRQVRRYRDARVRLHEATVAHRRAVEELEASSAEVVVAGAALCERVQILATSEIPSVVPRLPGFEGRRAA